MTRLLRSLFGMKLLKWAIDVLPEPEKSEYCEAMEATADRWAKRFEFQQGRVGQ